MRSPALLAALLLAACASQAPKTTLYLLPAEVATGTSRLTGPVGVGLGRVGVAPYLAESGLVIETAERQVRPARFHQWAEPLDDGLRHFLQIEISKACGYALSDDTTQRARWDSTLDIEIDRLHGTLSGSAVLIARWRVTASTGESQEFRFAASQPLPSKGYAGLVEAEIVLARQLAGAIAETLPPGR